MQIIIILKRENRGKLECIKPQNFKKILNPLSKLTCFFVNQSKLDQTKTVFNDKINNIIYLAIVVITFQKN